MLKIIRYLLYHFSTSEKMRHAYLDSICVRMKSTLTMFILSQNDLNKTLVFSHNWFVISIVINVYSDTVFYSK
jgi:hypothetical protein